MLTLATILGLGRWCQLSTIGDRHRVKGGESWGDLIASGVESPSFLGAEWQPTSGRLYKPGRGIVSSMIIRRGLLVSRGLSHAASAVVLLRSPSSVSPTT